VNRPRARSLFRKNTGGSTQQGPEVTSRGRGGTAELEKRRLMRGYDAGGGVKGHPGSAYESKV
jgi:hypothetical protein